MRENLEYCGMRQFLGENDLEELFSKQKIFLNHFRCLFVENRRSKSRNQRHPLPQHTVELKKSCLPDFQNMPKYNFHVEFLHVVKVLKTSLSDNFKSKFHFGSNLAIDKTKKVFDWEKVLEFFVEKPHKRFGQIKGPWLADREYLKRDAEFGHSRVFNWMLGSRFAFHSNIYDLSTESG